MNPKPYWQYSAEDQAWWDKTMKMELKTKNPNQHEANSAIEMVNNRLASKGVTRKDWPKRCWLILKQHGIRAKESSKRQRIGPSHTRRGDKESYFKWVIRDIFMENNCRDMKNKEIAREAEKKGYKYDPDKVSNTLQRNCATSPQYSSGNPDLFRKIGPRGVWALNQVVPPHVPS